MKNLTYKTKAVLTVFLALLITTACTDLKEEMYSGLAAEDFQATPDDLASLIGPAYVPMRAMMMGWQGYFDVMEEPADIMVTPVRPNGWYDGGTYQRMHRHTWTHTQWQPHNLWNNCFRIINTANRVIYQIESGDIPLEGELREQTIAELRGLRAWAYYILVDSHGNVPIVTDFSDPDLPMQNTRREVYDFAVNELWEVLPHLSSHVNTDTYGRFTRWAAYATLAKLYINAETYTGETPDWDLLIEVCDEIIEGGEFMLEANYKDNFTTQNMNSSEIIWSVPYDDVLATQWSQHMKMMHPSHRMVLNMEAQPWGGSCGVPQFIDTYHPNDTRKQDTWIMGTQYHLDTGDSLFTYDNYLPSIGGDFGDNPTMENGYRMGKYEVEVGAKSALSNDFVIFRYADVLMMKAEALLRSGNASEAAAIVSQVRARAFENSEDAEVTGADLLQGSSYNYGWYQNGEVVSPEGGDDIQYGRFLDELGWEFAGEARRRQDLIRFGVFTTKTWLNHNPSSEHRTIFPIPEAVMLNNSNLEQNPGY